MVSSKEKRRMDIINAAIEIFDKDGFHKGTVEDIAILAGIGKGTVYEYFTSKREIFESMIIEVLNRYILSIKEKTQDIHSFEGKIKAIFNSNLDFLEKNTDLLERLFFGLDESFKEIKPFINSFHKRLFDYFQSLVEFGIENNEINKDINKETLSLMLINIVYGLSNGSKIFNLKESPNIDEVMEIVFKGIK